MSDETTAQALCDAGIIERITCPHAFTVGGKAPLSPAGYGEHSIPQTIRIPSCRPGWFL